MFEKYLNNRFLILYVIPFFIGLLTVFSFQPFNITLLNFFILPIFFYFLVYINKRSKSTFRQKPHKKNLFIFGTLFGFGFYLSGISWIVNSLTFDDNFKILIPFALVLIPLFLSFFFGFSTLLVGPYLGHNFSSIFIFSGAIAFSDFLRAKLFTGFPWNLWAYSLSWSIEILQILNLIGLFAFNLIAITIFTLPAVLFFNIGTAKKIFFFIFFTILIASFYIYGSVKINENKNFLKTLNKKIYVKIISPNFKLEYGLSINKIEDRLKKLIRYSDPDPKKKTLFIWPEGVFSGYAYNEVLIFKNLINKNFSKNHHIIFGVNKLEKETGSLFNSLLLVNNKLEIIQQYNKQKLVPFGEFLPFENLLNKFGLKKVTEGYGSFQKGFKQDNIILDQLNILPLICYEVIFTKFIQEASPDTNLIISVSEDGWFGDSIGPNQHYAKLVFRAIEKGTFLLRSANRGISTILDNKGTSLKQLDRDEAGNIEMEVPLIKSKNNKNDLIFFILLITYFLIFNYKKKNMENNKFLFTSESVSEGHPDKVCDRISDMVVDSYLSKDPVSRVACETLATTNKVVLAGEVRGPKIDKDELINKVRECIKDIGYDQDGFSWKTANIETFLHEQSSDIAMGVDSKDNKDEGAGDQGIMFGYACNETEELMPAPIHYSHKILRMMAEDRKNGTLKGIEPDSKSQVTMLYEKEKPVKVTSVVISTQHSKNLNQEKVKDLILPYIKKSIPENFLTDLNPNEIYINPTGQFIIGGPDGDTGLTGRKIIVDTYGGAAPHGGGAFSGKDPTKVDRSAAYASRYLAKNIVASGVSEKCLIQLAYAIGVSKPLSIFIKLANSDEGKVEKIKKIIEDNFNLSPRGIREMLKLNNPIYEVTSAYGHFGRKPTNKGEFTWEKTDKTDLFKL